MKIAIIGYGKMGKGIEKMASGKHEVLVVNRHKSLAEQLEGCDVAIEFSVPEAAAKNITACIDAGVPVVSGTTGWMDDLKDIASYCSFHEGKFLYASNFSIGVQLFFQLNKRLSEMMHDYTDMYKVRMEEIHHTTKKDAPSGTAITLAEGIIEQHKQLEKWISIDEDSAGDEGDAIPILSKRIDEVKGTHKVFWSSSIDEIQIEHKAFSRDGFIIGAIKAAEWLSQQKEPGFYSMQDVLEG